MRSIASDVDHPFGRAGTWQRKYKFRHIETNVINQNGRTTRIENRNRDKFFYHEGEAVWAFSLFFYSHWKRWSSGKNCLQHSKTGIRGSCINTYIADSYILYYIGFFLHMCIASNYIHYHCPTLTLLHTWKCKRNK